VDGEWEEAGVGVASFRAHLDKRTLVPKTSLAERVKYVKHQRDLIALGVFGRFFQQSACNKASA
jgi:hypothetical protein